MKESRVGGDVKAAFAVAMVLTIGATLIGNGAIGWMVAPFALLLFCYCMAMAPLRVSMMVLMFFGLTLENPSEMPAQGLWKSPLWDLGALMNLHLKKVIGGGLFFSGMDIMLGFLGLVALARKFTGSRIDRAGAHATPRPLIRLAQLSLAGAAFAWVVGQVRGGADGSMALWQLDRVVYLPIVFLLFQAGLRGPRDHLDLAKIALAGATLRASQAVYVQWAVELEPNPYTGEAMLEYATTHHDSMLFAWWAVILIALLIQRAGRTWIWWSVALFPILIAGMIANQRRMVWVQIILVFITLYLATPTNPMKRKLQKALLFLSPLVAAYVAVGWNMTGAGGVFAPVQTIRSSVDSEVDASTLWRDIENFDLIFTVRQNPIFGTGYGHGFMEVIPLPPVPYLLERFIPHNSILGLWCYCGFVGYTAMTLLWVAGVYYAMRAYHHATERTDRAAAMACVGAVLIYYFQCYGDMGLGSWTGVYMMGAALAAAGKLAVATGAWTTTARRAASGAPAAAAAPQPGPTAAGAAR
jgi:hypothetical protein